MRRIPGKQNEFSQEKTNKTKHDYTPASTWEGPLAFTLEIQRVLTPLKKPHPCPYILNSYQEELNSVLQQQQKNKARKAHCNLRGIAIRS